jgi:phenylalanyl-tRNA synthetase beta chain
MKLSIQWLSDFLDLSSLGQTESERAIKVSELLTKRGLEVEEMHAQGAGLERVIVAHLLKRDPHPDSDRLSLCEVDTGTEKLAIVCGAQNMKAGDKVALAQVGAQLPNGLKIAQSKIRGAVSMGMLCSLTELGLGKESDGIIILPADAPIGTPIATYLKRSDVILVLKLTANRGDCLSHFGIAREVGSALGITPKLPELPQMAKSAGDSPVRIELRAGAEAPQFFGQQITGAQVRPSPDWVVQRLESLGMRSINSVVDATNLVMLELGHPVHAYDLNKIQDRSIGVRFSHPGEKLGLLDDSEALLTGEELVIADGENLSRPVGLAGVMGGGNSEVAPDSRDLFLECAQFSPSRVRKASSRFARKTEASHRFERGVDSAGLDRVMTRLTQWLALLAGGTQVGPVQSVRAENPVASPAVTLTPGWINGFLGTSFDSEEIRNCLVRLDCQVEVQASAWQVTPPSYRLDLKIREDFAEEVARDLGYDRIPSSVPVLTSLPGQAFATETERQLQALDQLKDVVVASGLNEAVNLALTSESWLKALNFDPSLRLQNPMSEELAVLSPSLLPGLIKNALGQMSRHFGSESCPIRLFEARPTYLSPTGTVDAAGSQDQTGAREDFKLAWLMTGPRWSGGLKADDQELEFKDVRALFDLWCSRLGVRGVRLIGFDQSRTQGAPQFHPGQSVEILAGNQVAGHFGRLHPKIARALKCDSSALWIGEVSWSVLARLARPVTKNPVYQAWGEFPGMERDFALVVAENITCEQLTAIATKIAKPLAKSVRIFDIYRGKPVADGQKSVAVRVVFSDDSRSLQEPEVEGLSQKLIEAWKKDLGATLR